MRIQSLFIDEVFGPLDSEALDLAPDAPEGLRQGNKSIGVISHVGLLNSSPHLALTPPAPASSNPPPAT